MSVQHFVFHISLLYILSTRNDLSCGKCAARKLNKKSAIVFDTHIGVGWIVWLTLVQIQFQYAQRAAEQYLLAMYLLINNLVLKMQRSY